MTPAARLSAAIEVLADIGGRRRPAPDALKDWGFDHLPIPFLAYGPFGGAFHCATLDVRRRGTLEDYS